MSRARVLVSLLFAAVLGGAYAQAGPDLPVITVLDFAATSVSAAEARVITDVLSTYIVRTGAYRVIDRNQREAILEEIEFSYSDCSDRSCQLEIGRLLSAAQLVVGSIGRIEGWLVATVRLVAVPTGQVLGSVSEKYPSLEAVIDGLPELAAQTARAGGREAGAHEELTAQSLVTSAKRAELEAHLQRLRRRTAPQLYARWLAEGDFTEYEVQAPIEEKLEFLEEFQTQSNTRGHAVETSLSYLPFQGRGTDSDGGYSLASGALAGWTLSWSYQFSNRLSAGAFWYMAWHREQGREYDSLGVFLKDYQLDRADYCLGASLILGNKTESFALLLSSGYGIGLGALIPLRCGLYFRNFYLGYLGLYSTHFDQMLNGLEAGYSLFLGRRRSWPLAAGSGGR
jgi:TolB-like protein